MAAGLPPPGKPEERMMLLGMLWAVSALLGWADNPPRGASRWALASALPIGALALLRAVDHAEFQAACLKLGEPTVLEKRPVVGTPRP